jgi:hypothetical protein
MQPFIEYIAGQWEVISQALPTFAVASILGGILIWMFRRSFYTSQIITLNERIKLRDDQLHAMEKSVHAESPSDALLKIGELTAKVEALSLGAWDAPSELQIAAFRHQIERLTPSKIEIEVGDDARALGYPIVKVFDQLGWDVEIVRLIGGNFGLGVAPDSDLAKTIAMALRSVTSEKIKILESRGAPLSIVIGEKPYQGIGDDD